MKIMFISDIHGDAVALRKAIYEFKEMKADKLIILGDYFNYYGISDDDEKEIIESFNALKNKIIAVRGNCDSSFTIMNLPIDISAGYRELDIDGRKMFITHGHIFKNIPETLKKGDLYVQGHTHRPMLRNENGVWHINPGSIAKPRGEYEASYAVYEDGICYIRQIDDGKYIYTDQKL